MAILMSSVNWVIINFFERLAAKAPYVYGGVYSPTDFGQGCDCSGLVGWVLEALVNTPAKMSWEHVVSTESWTYDYSTGTPAAPGTVGPYNTVAVASLADIPVSSALTICIMHGGGGESSHTHCDLAGTVCESNGGNAGFAGGTCTQGTGAYADDASLWTDFWYLPGPIVFDTTPHWLIYDQLLGGRFEPLSLQLTA